MAGVAPGAGEPMTARQEILEVARDLTARGLAPFSPKQVVAELQQRGTRYRESTIRTHVVDIMCADSPHEGTVSFDDLRRVARGLYVLNGQPEGGAAVARPSRINSSETDTNVVEPDPRSWSWEGNVQTAFARFLADEGWTIVATADTASRQQGPDVVARRDDLELVAEVKGYPQTTKTSVATQARTYVGNALLTGLLAWAERPRALIGLVFPDAPTYRKLVQRMRPPFERLGVAVWFVHEDGRVEPWLVPASSRGSKGSA
jgi:Holliday junction resolvase